MKIKTYLVGSLSEAVDRIKRELGPQAVILSTRKVPANNKWWQKNETGLEVTAAVDAVGRASGVEPDRTVPQPGQIFRMLQQMTEEQLEPLRTEITQMRKMLNEKQGDNKQSATSSIITSPNVDTNTYEESEADAAIYAICQRLLWHRLNPRIVEELADKLITLPQGTSPDSILETAASLLMEHIPEPSPLNADPREDRVIALLGPTGAGKTTTLVKMASRLSLEGKRSVAFITIDHFRVGAEEQLKKYADILKAPCALAVNKEQVEAAIERFADIDLIFIDTTGRSPSDTEGVQRLRDTLDINRPIWRSLVLPVSLQEPDLTNTIAQFRMVGFKRLMMTKLDEAVSYGSLFNASYIAQCPLSFFTTGQQVPDDFEPASKERIIDCLLNFSGQYDLPDMLSQKSEEVVSGRGALQ